MSVTVNVPNCIKSLHDVLVYQSWASNFIQFLDVYRESLPPDDPRVQVLLRDVMFTRKKIEDLILAIDMQLSSMLQYASLVIRTEPKMSPKEEQEARLWGGSKSDR